MHITPRLIALLVMSAALGCESDPHADPVDAPPVDAPSEPETPAEPEAPEPEAHEPEAPIEPEAPAPEPPIEPMACPPDEGAPQAECGGACAQGTDFAEAQLVAAWIPSAIAAGDLNQDGRDDVVAAHYALSALSVQFANADGSLGPRQILPIEGLPSAVDAGDFNDDAIVDLITITEGRVHVLLGAGAGDFLAPLISDARTVNPSVSALAVADLDGDGVLDVLLGHTYNRGEALSVLIGQGDGRFEAGQRALLAGSVIAVQAADLNQDGHVDLLFLEESQVTLGVMLGQGQGRFAGPVQHEIEAGAFITTADVNQDGLIDVMVLGVGPTKIWLTQPDGSLQAHPTFVLEPQAIAAIDVSGDGQVDFITADATDVAVFRHTAEQGVESPPLRYPIGLAIAAVGADANADGHRDVFVAVSDSGQIGVLLGQADGSFAATAPVTEGVSPWATASADLNGDGAPDLVNVYLGTNTLSVALGRGDGSFDAFEFYPVGGGPRFVAIADMDGDCLPDLLVASANEGLSVLFGVGEGRFAPAVEIARGLGINAVAATDLNGDGLPDVVATAWSAGRGRRGRVLVWLGTGGGALAHAADHIAGYSPVSLTVADLNGDGAPDVVVGDYDRYNSGVSVLLGDGEGGLGAERRVLRHGEQSSVEVADVDGDGALDLITANSFTNSISVLRGLGDGAFAEAVSYPAGNRPASVAVADVDGDCVLDVIVVSAGTNDLRILEGAGDGTFSHAQTHRLGGYARGLAIADFDQDGRVDLAAANSGTTTLTVLLNLGCAL